MCGTCKDISRYALQSLLYEVSASPKPGLVDRFNQGAHKDMNFYTFMASSASLVDYFNECVEEGLKFAGLDAREMFKNLRAIGIEAEKAMYQATHGINTQKGLIFSLGVICAAASCCMKENKTDNLDIDVICTKISLMTKGLCSQELGSMTKVKGLTNGERLYKKYGFKGIRGEVENGFPTVRNHSLPFLKQLKSIKKYDLNDMFVQTLLYLVSINEDTNIAARHNKETMAYAQRYARCVLDAGGILTQQGKEMVFEMDRNFIKKNISPGGSADLLAVTIMFDLMSE